MNFEQLAMQRRSVRKFEDRPVGQDIVDRLINITLTAPSSKNCRSTRLAYTDNPELLRIVSDMRSTGTHFVARAPFAFFVLADDTDTDLWRENCSISATVLQLAAESLGLGSCWVHVEGRPHRNEDPDGLTAGEYLKQHIPALEPYRILCVVACGYPAARPAPHTLSPEDSDKSFRIG